MVGGEEGAPRRDTGGRGPDPGGRARRGGVRPGLSASPPRLPAGRSAVRRASRGGAVLLGLRSAAKGGRERGAAPGGREGRAGAGRGPAGAAGTRGRPGSGTAGGGGGREAVTPRGGTRGSSRSAGTRQRCKGSLPAPRVPAGRGEAQPSGMARAMYAGSVREGSQEVCRSRVSSYVIGSRPGCGRRGIGGGMGTAK